MLISASNNGADGDIYGDFEIRRNSADNTFTSGVFKAGATVSHDPTATGSGGGGYKPISFDLSKIGYPVDQEIRPYAMALPFLIAY